MEIGLCHFDQNLTPYDQIKKNIYIDLSYSFSQYSVCIFVIFK